MMMMREMNGGYKNRSRVAVLSSHFIDPSSSSSSTSSSLLSMAAASEKEAALAAAPTEGPTIFDKIIRKEISSTVVYEDEKMSIFTEQVDEAIGEADVPSVKR